MHTRNNSAESGRLAVGAAEGAIDSPVPDRRLSSLLRSCAGAPTGFREHSRHFVSQLAQRHLEGPCACHEDEIHAGCTSLAEVPIRLAQPPFRAISTSRSSDLSAHREARAPGPLARYPEEHECASFLSSAGLEYRLDFVGLPEAGGAGKSEFSDSSAHSSVARR